MLRLVDDQHRAAVQRHQRQQEVMQRPNQLVLAGRREAARPQCILRHHAKAEEHFSQQLLDRQERIENQRRERRLIEQFEQRAAQRGLTRADVAGEDDKTFFAADGLPDLLQGEIVRLTAVEKPRIGRQTERGLNETVVVLVHLLGGDRKSTRLNSSHSQISYAVFCLKKKKKKKRTNDNTLSTY